MFEKVNPSHPDKLADRIAGAIVDMAYAQEDNPRIAVEVLLGHEKVLVIAETNVHISLEDIGTIVERIAHMSAKCVEYIEVPQNFHLAINQHDTIRCGDNGIFKGCPTTQQQKFLKDVASIIYREFPSDGKYLIADNNEVTICQSCASKKQIVNVFYDSRMLLELCGSSLGFSPTLNINPLGMWGGGPSVDCGATNRKLGSDMGDAVTGGGLHGKDLSKADVSLNIYCFLKAQETGKSYSLSCSIGDETVDGKPYSEIVEIAREYINSIGGFEKFAEWGLIR